jgi:hypothetical protein
MSIVRSYSKVKILERAIRDGSDLNQFLDVNIKSVMRAFEAILNNPDGLSTTYFYSALRQFEPWKYRDMFVELILKGNIITAKLFYDLGCNRMFDTFFRILVDYTDDVDLLQKISTWMIFVGDDTDLLYNINEQTVETLITTMMHGHTDLTFFMIMSEMFPGDKIYIGCPVFHQTSKKIKILLGNGIQPQFYGWGSKVTTDNYQSFYPIIKHVEGLSQRKRLRDLIFYYRQASTFDFSDLKEIIYPDIMGIIGQYAAPPKQNLDNSDRGISLCYW